MIYSILGCNVDLGNEVRFLVKSEKILLSENWEKTKSGGLKKLDVFYKFTKAKSQFCGKVISGTITKNPKDKICIKDKNGWGYDESMIKSLIRIEESPFQTFSADFDGLYFVGENDGSLYITTEDHDCNELEFGLTKHKTQELINKLLKFHRWIE